MMFFACLFWYLWFFQEWAVGFVFPLGLHGFSASDVSFFEEMFFSCEVFYILFCAAYFSSHVDFASMFHICVASCIFGSLFLVILSGFTYFLASMHVFCVLLEPSLHDCFALKLMKNFCLCSETQ